MVTIGRIAAWTFVMEMEHAFVLILHRTSPRTFQSATGNESVPIELAQCWFPGLAISNAKI